MGKKGKLLAGCGIAVVLLGAVFYGIRNGKPTGGSGVSMEAESGLGTDKGAAVNPADNGEVTAEIHLEQDNSTAKGTGVSVSGNVITVKSAGTYRISGKLTDGQLRVEAGKDETVCFVLGGTEISNGTEAAVHVENAKLVSLYLEEGSKNRFISGIPVEINTEGENDGADTDSGTDQEAGNGTGDGAESEGSGGTVYARDDLAVLGPGSLEVLGYINNGIQTSNRLALEGGEIKVEAVNHGIKGKDSVTVTGGTFSILSGGDGIKSDDTMGDGYGEIIISDGNFDIVSGQDGIQAETKLTINNGSFSIKTGGGYETVSAEEMDFNGGPGGGFDGGAPGGGPGGGFGGRGPGGPGGGFGGRGPGGPEGGPPMGEPADHQFGEGFGVPDSGWDMEEEALASAKGLKAGKEISITGGSFSLDCQDDAVHCNGEVRISNGDFSISSGDDGIHADDTLLVSGGQIQIMDSYEGLEANQLLIQEGVISVKASDDGMNAYGGQNGRGFGGGKTTENFPKFYMTGGTVSVNAGGDGVDSNGDLIVEGGCLVVDGPADDRNGALDSGSENGGRCLVNGGTVLAVGSSGMAETFGEESAQYSFCYHFDTAFQPGDEMIITDSQGNEIYRHTAQKSGSSVVFSSPELEESETYHISAGELNVEIQLEGKSTRGGSRNGGGQWNPPPQR